MLGSMLLNRLRLQPGEAIYLGAGQLHAYLNGMGVEIMANSDNVLRGGLTSKHVDVVELLRVLSFRPLPEPVLQSHLADDGWNDYDAPVREFRLRSRKLKPGENVRLNEESAMIVLSTEGSVTLRHDDSAIDLASGHAAWIPAVDAVDIEMTSGEDGASVFVATVPRVS